MKILQVHNAYQIAGGEEAVIESERSVLERNSHTVEQWIVDSSGISDLSLYQQAQVALSSIWSKSSYNRIKAYVREQRPDVVHVHNTVPLITPSVYAACQSEGVPVIQTLHNYKLVCPGSNLYRDNNVCESCVGKSFPYPALLHGCYRREYARNSFSRYAGTTFLVANIAYNHMRGSYFNEVTTYIALTEFARGKFIESGFPREKIAVKPNFVTSQVAKGSHTGEYALFAGRLINQKGVITLIEAWSRLNIQIPLKIAGTGNLSEYVKSKSSSTIQYLGQLPRTEVISLMQDATLFIVPSEWYEGFPMSIVEAFATGLPVVASKLGSMAEIVKSDMSGWHFEPGNAEDLAQTVERAWQDKGDIRRRGKMAYKQYRDLYSPEANYSSLLEIYEDAILSVKK